MNENTPREENALYEPPAFEEMGSFQEATAGLVFIQPDPFAGWGGML